MESIGLITYDTTHLKTEQFLLGTTVTDKDYTLYALPFVQRKPRKVLFQHRPNQTQAAHSRSLAEYLEIPYKKVAEDTDIDNHHDLYIVLGAGILSADFVRGKKILNIHPGVIPASRGLDSFKWSIVDNKPLGVSMHYIDEEVDAGELISVVPTPVFVEDTLDSLARRHYQIEMDLLCDFEKAMNNRSNPFEGIEIGEARMRMPLSIQETLSQTFEEYKSKHACNS